VLQREVTGDCLRVLEQTDLLDRANHHLFQPLLYQVATAGLDADDVSCTHGATVGRLDEDSLFYLRSRGIPERSARAMLIRAFAETTLDQEFPPGPGRDWLAASASAAIDAVLEGEVAATPSGKDSQ